MQALLTYESDDSNDFNEEARSPALIAADGTEADGESCSPPVESNTSSAKETNVTTVDFFGLQESDSDEDGASASKRKCVHHCPINKISVSGVEIELPQSEFWEKAIDENVSTDELLSNIGSCDDQRSVAQDHGAGNEYQIGYGNRFHETVSPASFSRTCTSVPMFNQPRSDVLRKYHCPKKDTSGCKGEIPIRHMEDANDRRKVYCIHSKIAPYLHSASGMEQTFKVPKSILKTLPGHSGVVNRVKWCSPNFSHLLLSSSMDTTVKVWNCWSQMDPCVRTIKSHTKAVKDAEWSLCGRTILSCSYDRTAVLTDVETGKMERCFNAPDYLTCGKFHPGNRNVLTVGTKNCVLCWDIRTPENPSKRFTHKDTLGQVQDVVVSRDGSQLFACNDIVSRDSADRNIIAWDFPSTVLLSNQIFQERYTCTRLKLHPTEGNFLAQTHGNYIAIFSVNRPYKMNKYRRYEGHKLMGYSLGFDISSDGSLVASGSSDGQLYFYHYQSGKRLKTLDTGWGVCMDVAFHPVLFSTLASCSWEGQITLWQ